MFPAKQFRASSVIPYCVLFIIFLCFLFPVILQPKSECTHYYSSGGVLETLTYVISQNKKWRNLSGTGFYHPGEKRKRFTIRHT